MARRQTVFTCFLGRPPSSTWRRTTLTHRRITPSQICLAAKSMWSSMYNAGNRPSDCWYLPAPAVSSYELPWPPGAASAIPTSACFPVQLIMT